MKKHNPFLHSGLTIILVIASILTFAGFCLITNTGGALRIYWDSQIPFVYRLHTSTPANYIPSIEAGHLAWNVVDGSYFDFVRGDNTSATGPGMDGVNLVFFDITGINFPPPTSVIAFSQTFTSSAGGYRAVESDLVWNARDFPPSPTGAPGAQDLQSVMTHEFGHHLGLDHTGLPSGANSGCGPQVQPATMWWSSSNGDTTKRSLHPEDIMGVSALYPSWRLQGLVTDLQGFAVENAALLFKGTYASQVGPVHNPIGSRYNRAGFLLDTIYTDASGLYSTVVINQSFDVIVDGFGYERDSSRVQFNPPGGIGQTQVITHNVSIQPTPLAALSGIVRNASTQAPVQARVEIVGIGDPDANLHVVNTQPDGSYSVMLSSKEYYRLTIYPAAPYIDFVRIPSIYLDPSGTNYTANVFEAQVLIVDDDAGQNFQLTYQNSIDRLGLYRRTFSVADSGTTPAAVLSSFATSPVVIWSVGNDSVNALTPAERLFLIGFLEGGGRLVLSGQNLAEFSQTNDTLLARYLGIRYDGLASTAFLRGYAGDVIGNGVNYLLTGGQTPLSSKDILALVPGSVGTPVPTLYYLLGSDTTRYAGVRVTGPGSSWAATYFGFGLEGLPAVRVDTFLTRSFRFFNQQTVSVDEESIPEGPQQFVLEQNYPNPFNPSTEIRYGIPGSAHVSLTIYDVLGREVATLVNGNQEAGIHTVRWDGSGVSGRSISSGLYFYRLDATSRDGRRSTTLRKMLLVK